MPKKPKVIKLPKIAGADRAANVIREAKEEARREMRARKEKLLALQLEQAKRATEAYDRVKAASMIDIVHNCVVKGDDIRICPTCADLTGGTWPMDHAATFGPATCGVCAKEGVSCCALSDYEWPWPSRKLDREF